MLVLSLVEEMEIVGEAAYQTSEATRQKILAIPWDDIIRMRHRLVHAITKSTWMAFGELSRTICLSLLTDWSNSFLVKNREIWFA